MTPEIKKGFTLVELLITIALISISVGVTTDIILSITQSYTKTQITNEVEQNAQFVLLKLSKELRSAKSVNINASGTILVLTTPDGANVKYCFSSNNLYRNGNSSDLSTCSGSQLVDSTWVSVACGSGTTADATSQCFGVSSSVPPYVTRVAFTFRQSTGSSSTQFQGSSIIDETIVSRGSY